MTLTLRRVRIRNYKSIAKCDIELQPLTLLVGRNGSGKSNFLDALRFVVDALGSSLDHAIKSRGGVDAVRRRSTGHPNNFGIELDLELAPENLAAKYGFEISAVKDRGYEVRWERLRITRGNWERTDGYVVRSGVLDPPDEHMPAALADRLYLVNTSGLPQFRPVYDALSSMSFYNLSPEAMKQFQSPDAGEYLHRDGSNIASVLARLAKDKAVTWERITDYLRTIVPGITSVERVQFGPSETLEFRQKIEGSKHPWRFYASSMSDGTLRALGALVAVSQVNDRVQGASVIGIEEPETALHPAATGALIDALREATVQTQIIVTTHSPELLDCVDPSEEGLLIVTSEDGTTSIGKVDQASLEAVKDHLYTPGDMLRMDQLMPDKEDLERQLKLPFFESDEVSS